MADADRAFDSSTPASQPGLEGICTGGRSYLAGQMAHCYADLGLPELAAGAAAEAGAAYPIGHVRRRVMNAGVLSRSLVAAGRLEEAVAIGHEALAAAAGLRSSRAFDEIRRLEGAIAPYRGERFVREFLDRAQQLSST